MEKVRSFGSLIRSNFSEKKETLRYLASELAAVLFLIFISGAIGWLLVALQAMSWWFVCILDALLAVIGFNFLCGKEDAEIGRVFLFLSISMATGAVLGSVPLSTTFFLARPFVQALGITLMISLTSLMLTVVLKPRLSSKEGTIVAVGVFSFSLIVIYHLQPQAVFVRWIAFGGICLMTIYETITTVSSQLFGEKNYLRYPLALFMDAILMTGLLVSPPLS